MFLTSHAHSLLTVIGEAAGIRRPDQAALERIARGVGLYYAQVKDAEGLRLLPRTVRDGLGGDDVALEAFLRVPPALLQRHAEGGVLVVREDEDRPYDAEYAVI